MKPIGLTFAEVVELTIRPRLRMTRKSVCGQLQARGYDCQPAMLELLLQNRVVTPADPDAWSQADVEVAAGHFEACGIHTQSAAMCEALGCRYVDYLRSLQEASKRESTKYGRPVPADDRYFVMHRVPPREGQPAMIVFSLCDDVRKRLKRGEAV